jgi:POT family proton-dependent oligopeptide transporter
MRELFGHPKGLYVLFFTEMWERFSYYGMRALLILYLTKHFLFGEQAYAIYGSYTALVYATPVIGGLIADRYLGCRKAVTIGAILLVLGHFGMAFEGPPARQIITAQGGEILRDPLAEQTLYFSLALLITGVGFLKPNISTIVGRLYEPGDRRRDSGFTIFYMGINLGSVLATAACGYLGETYGWRYGFGLAGLGMACGLTVYLWGQRFLAGHAEPPDPAGLRRKVIAGLSTEHLLIIATILAVPVIWQLVQNHAMVGGLLGVTAFFAVCGIIAFSLFRCSRTERDRIVVALVLMFFSVLFWAFVEQAGSSLNLFADRNINREVLGVTIKASQYQMLNPAFIILLAPGFAALWIGLARRRLEPSTPVKFALGLFQVGAGFAILVFGASLAGADGKVAVIWLVLSYLLQTTGELCLSPVGLSMTTKLSVPRIASLMMGVWFLASAGASYIAALIARATESGTPEGNGLDGYISVFTTVALAAIGAGLVLLLISPALRRRMHGVH